MRVVTDTCWEAELNELLREFYPDGTDITVLHRHSDSEPADIFTVEGKEYPFFSVFPQTRENLAKRNAKLGLYDALCAHTGRSLPWGSLTGVRPTKLFYEAVRLGMDFGSAARFMTDVYRISEKKAALLMRIAVAQDGLPSYDPTRDVNLYVHVPFCNSRCSYCSFVSLDAARHKKYIRPYVDRLTEEIERGREFLTGKGYRIYSVYIGGGTPTSVPPEALEKILTASRSECEFTCEAGRPDTINDEIADVMKRCGVNRLCVNPQSLSEKTLREIGRSHTAEDFFRAYKLIKDRGFSINTDIIAGLPGEGIGEFADTLSGITRLRPDNVTVHTLALKNGSKIKEKPYAGCDETEEMVDLAQTILTASGYAPYYLYRQKQMQGNLENVGYARDGKACVNNVTTMEDILSVFACGAGAISKFIDKGGARIRRLANVRDVGLYIDLFDSRIAKKEAFFTAEKS